MYVDNSAPEFRLSAAAHVSSNANERLDANPQTQPHVYSFAF